MNSFDDIFETSHVEEMIVDYLLEKQSSKEITDNEEKVLIELLKLLKGKGKGKGVLSTSKLRK